MRLWTIAILLFGCSLAAHLLKPATSDKDIVRCVKGQGSSICIKVKNSLFVRSCNTGSDRPNTLAWGSRSGRTLNQTSSHIISIIFAYVQIYFAVLLWLERNRQQECVVYVVCVQRHWSCCFQNCCRSSQLLCPKISWCETFAGSASYKWLVHKQYLYAYFWQTAVKGWLRF